jgi:hypothetical protein
MDLRAGYLKCDENYWKFEDLISYSFREMVQIIERQLEGLKIPDRQRNFDMAKKKKTKKLEIDNTLEDTK